MTYDPATIAAFVDGELDDIAARRMARDAESDSDLAAAIASHRALKQRLTAHYAPVLDEAVPDRLTKLIAASAAESARIDTSLTARREEKKARFAAVHWGAIAASLALGLSIGLRPWLPAADVAVDGGTLIAAGPLADALDTQLASNQPATASVRIGLSFRDREGRYCRSFESSNIGGIGCQAGGQWQLEQTLKGGTTTDYRQASSGALANAVADMMADAPLDATAERAARDMGWVR